MLPNHPFDLRFLISKSFSCQKHATSRLQPLDARIIQNFKVKYRKFLLKFVISRVEKQTTAVEIAKEIDILKAIGWIQEAWVSVSEDTMRKCSQNCGFTDDNCAEVDTNDEEFASLVKEINSEVSPEDFTAVDNTALCHNCMRMANSSTRRNTSESHHEF